MHVLDMKTWAELLAVAEAAEARGLDLGPLVEFLDLGATAGEIAELDKKSSALRQEKAWAGWYSYNGKPLVFEPQRARDDLARIAREEKELQRKADEIEAEAFADGMATFRRYAKEGRPLELAASHQVAPPELVVSMTKQVDVFAENEALKAALGQLTEASQQRSRILFFMFFEGLGSLVAAARSGDQGAKRVCSEIKNLLRELDALASDIVIPR